MENAKLKKPENILHATGKYLVLIAVAISVLLGAHLLWQTADNEFAVVQKGTIPAPVSEEPSHMFFGQEKKTKYSQIWQSPCIPSAQERKCPSPILLAPLFRTWRLCVPVCWVVFWNPSSQPLLLVVG